MGSHSMSNGAYMPPENLPDGKDPVALLDAYVQAEGWFNGSESAKQMRAWEKRRDKLRAMILERMK